MREDRSPRNSARHFSVIEATTSLTNAGTDNLHASKCLVVVFVTLIIRQQRAQLLRTEGSEGRGGDDGLVSGPSVLAGLEERGDENEYDVDEGDGDRVIPPSEASSKSELAGTGDGARGELDDPDRSESPNRPESPDRPESPITGDGDRLDSVLGSSGVSALVRLLDSGDDERELKNNDGEPESGDNDLHAASSSLAGFTASTGYAPGISRTGLALPSGVIARSIADST
ncbi:hypothetical protein FPQ18DRAFT_419499 [Pyronema domesticum]|nr:hypothetical protein FPQ18DRAFT_419499 [Pyronema domesticum]